MDNWGLIFFFSSTFATSRFRQPQCVYCYLGARQNVMQKTRSPKPNVNLSISPSDGLPQPFFGTFVTLGWAIDGGILALTLPLFLAKSTYRV